jgi:hypothetical protein
MGTGRRQPHAREGGEEQAGAPFREVEFDIAYGTGVNRAGEIVDLGAEAGLIEKSGSFYSWNGQRLGQGRDKAAATWPNIPRFQKLSVSLCWRGRGPRGQHGTGRRRGRDRRWGCGGGVRLPALKQGSVATPSVRAAGGERRRPFRPARAHEKAAPRGRAVTFRNTMMLSGIVTLVVAAGATMTSGASQPRGNNLLWNGTFGRPVDAALEPGVRGQQRRRGRALGPPRAVRAHRSSRAPTHLQRGVATGSRWPYTRGHHYQVRFGLMHGTHAAFDQKVSTAGRGFPRECRVRSSLPTTTPTTYPPRSTAVWTASAPSAGFRDGRLTGGTGTLTVCPR